MTTLSAALAEATARLVAAQTETPKLDARLLLQWASGVDTARLISEPDAVLPDDKAELFQRAVAERADGRPVARIIGEKEFWGLDFHLSPETLVPRPDTETLVEAVLGQIRQPHATWAGSICDLGAGSGAIVIALLHELPMARGLGVDLSQDAVATAGRNGERHGISGRVTWRAGDFADLPREPFDIVVSNPPYIAEPEFSELSAEVRQHDPHLALAGGHDGLDAYRIIARRLPQLLRFGGFAALEIGYRQVNAVTELIVENGLEMIGVKADIAGIPRVLLVHSPSGVAPLTQPRC